MAFLCRLLSKNFKNYSEKVEHPVAASSGLFSSGSYCRSPSQKQRSIIALKGLIKTAGHRLVNGSFVRDCFQLCLIVF